MAHVVVVGGGFAGLAAAGRIAKLRHSVTLIESTDRLGGQLNGWSAGGKTWQLQQDTVTLPGVFRDLFRKSGRVMDASLGFTKTFGRRHVFGDGTVLDLPLGNRGDQHEAMVHTFGRDDWSRWVDQFAEQWEAGRRAAIDSLFDPATDLTRSLRSTLAVRKSATSLARDFDDPRLRAMVTDPLTLAGHRLKDTPRLVGIGHYLERSFGRWEFDGGLPGLAAALTTRMLERRIDLRLETTAHDVIWQGGRAVGVTTDDGTVSGDAVVWAAPHLPASYPAPRLAPVEPASRTLVSIAPGAVDLPREILAHGPTPIRLWSANSTEWTIEHRSLDPLADLTTLGIDLASHVTERHDLSGRELQSMSPWGWRWKGWKSALRLPGVAPEGGLFFTGVLAHPGPMLEAVGLASAAIAEDFRASAPPARAPRRRRNPAPAAED